jgi:hypothetical protein
MVKMITSNIARSKTLVDLSDIYCQWGDSFDHIHASAALVKCSKLPGGGRRSLVDKLCSSWLTQLSFSGLQGCANVLWASVKLGPGPVARLWGPTWEAYVKLLQQKSAKEPMSPQTLANPLWAFAKLRKQPLVGELQLLLQTFLQPALLANGKPQDLSNIIWALGELCQLASWQGGVSEQDVQQLLGKQQLLLVGASGSSSQVTSNVVLGLAHMATCKAPIISVGFARDCSKQLLSSASGSLVSWTPQELTNTMWSCGQLGLADTPFVAAAVAAAPRWVPASNVMGVAQAALASAAVQCTDEQFVQVLLQHMQALLQQQQQQQRSMKQNGSKSRKMAGGRASAGVAACGYAIARLNLVQFAGTVKSMVVISGVGGQNSGQLAELRRLWVFHSWLVENELLDGKGLAGVLTQQQLETGVKEAAVYGNR